MKLMKKIAGWTILSFVLLGIAFGIPYFATRSTNGITTAGIMWYEASFMIIGLSILFLGAIGLILLAIHLINS